jgi:hypothetical protein
MHWILIAEDKIQLCFLFSSVLNLRVAYHHPICVSFRKGTGRQHIVIQIRIMVR